MKKNNLVCAALCLTAALLAALFAGCAQGAPEASPSGEEKSLYTDEVKLVDQVLEIEDQEIPTSESPAVSAVLMPRASGTTVLGNKKASIDASNLQDGYVMIRYLEKTDKRLKVLVTGPSGVTYNYNLTGSGEYEVFPLSDGSGTYKVGVYVSTTAGKYASAYAASLKVELKDEFAPFLLPNQYVNYTEDSKAVAQAQKLVQGKTDELEKIAAIYNYVVKNISYDKELAATVKSGYLPDLDQVLESKKGICFDYAALMACMLRSQGIPTKLVVGYSGKAYHAWINTYVEKVGWVDNVIYFDGTTWKLMDPTYASSGNSSEAIMKYIGDGSNYTAKFLY